MSNLREFKLELYDRTALCGQDKPQEEVVRWLSAVEVEGIEEKDVVDPGRDFESLDRKLAIALQSILPKELEMKINNVKADLLAKRGRLISGRQVLWHIYRHLRTNVNQDAVYGVVDIARIQWLGDKNKAKFLTFWESRMSQMQGKCSNWMKAEVLYRAMMESTDLKIEMMSYLKEYPVSLGQHKGEKRYNALKEILHRTIAREREEVNRSDREAHDRRMWERLVPNHPAAPAPSKGKGKGKKGKDAARSSSKGPKGEGKSKGKQRSQSAKGRGKGSGGKGGEREKGLCVNFVVNGSCSRGNECSYRHEKPKDSTEEKFYKDLHKRLASRSNSPANKGKGRGECRSWQATGTCKYGDACKYSHVTGPAAPVTSSRQQKRSNSRPRKVDGVSAPATTYKGIDPDASACGSFS